MDVTAITAGCSVVDREGEALGTVVDVVASSGADEPTHVVVTDADRPGWKVAIAATDIDKVDRNRAHLALSRADIDRLESVRGVPPAQQSGLIALDPDDVGLGRREVTITDVEPMREIANEARGTLRKRGFTDTEIDDWARQFVARRGLGDVDEFLEWIEQEEQTRNS